MGTKKHKPEEVVAKLWQVDVLVSQGQSVADRTAVEAVLALSWSTSPVEGQINRVKKLKRTMYGRAKLDLLRARVPAA